MAELRTALYEGYEPGTAAAATAAKVAATDVEAGPEEEQLMTAQTQRQ